MRGRTAPAGAHTPEKHKMAALDPLERDPGLFFIRSEGQMLKSAQVLINPEIRTGRIVLGRDQWHALGAPSIDETFELAGGRYLVGGIQREGRANVALTVRELSPRTGGLIHD